MFKGFTNLYKEDLRDGTAFKYYVGLYKKIVEAESGLVKVKNAGYKDAYIIGFYNGKVIPLSRAKELELTNGKL
jgi:N-acetylmuramoyl-L-alanine amidase